MFGLVYIQKKMFIPNRIIEPLLCGLAVMFLNYGNVPNRMEIVELFPNIDITYELIQLKNKKITWDPNKDGVKYLFSATQPKTNIIVPNLRKSI